MEDRYAAFKPRASAALVDFLLIAAYAAILYGLTTILILTPPLEQRLDSAFTRDLVAFGTLILPVVLYFSIQESSTRQATYGKQMAGLQVIRIDGSRLSFGRALLRSGLKFLPWQMAHSAVFQIWAGNTSPTLLTVSILAQILVVIYLLSLVVSRQRRTPYDWLVGTAVIKVERAVQEPTAAVKGL